MSGMGLVAAILFACSPNSSAPTTVVPENRTTDSVAILIDLGKDAQTEEKKLELFQKAWAKAKNTANDSLRTKQLGKLSLAYLMTSDTSNFKKVNKKVLELAQETNDSVSLAEAHWDRAAFFRSNSSLDSAYYHFAEAQKLYAGFDEFSAARMLYNMASVQTDIKDYTGSEITTVKAIEILEPLKKYKQLYYCYNNLGVVANNLEDYDRAIEYHETAMDYLERWDRETTLLQDTNNNIGVVYQNKGDHREAVARFEAVLSTEGLLEKDPRLYAKALNNLAYSKMVIGDAPDLGLMFTKAVDIQDSIDDKTGVSRSRFRLAQYYLQRGDSTKALAQARIARELAQESDNNNRLLETYKLLWRLDPGNAVTYTQNYISLNDSLQKEERRVRDKFTRIRFETDQVIAENIMLAREKQLWTGIAAIMLLLAAAVYTIVNQRAKNQKLRFQQEQQAANLEIFNLMLSQKQKVEEGKKLEQKRISEELHDGVLGKMLGARMVLTGLNKKDSEEAIQERMNAIEALKNVEKEVRSISHELSHAAYQEMHNFIHSITDLLQSVTEANHLN